MHVIKEAKSKKAKRPELLPALLSAMIMTTSWYGPGFIGNLTANGETFTAKEMTAAHKTLPFGTKLKVTNPENCKSVVVRVNDRGPFIEGRDLDLSQAAAEELGMIDAGVKDLFVEVLESEDD